MVITTRPPVFSAIIFAAPAISTWAWMFFDNRAWVTSGADGYSLTVMAPLLFGTQYSSESFLNSLTQVVPCSRPSFMPHRSSGFFALISLPLGTMTAAPVLA
ncbi:hypothetical protein D3C76_1569870 [compost metagenome]